MKFSECAQKTLSKAHDCARDAGRDSVVPADILCGLSLVQEGVAWRAISELKIDLAGIPARIAREFPKLRSAAQPGELPFSPDTKALFNTAIDIATSMDMEYVGTEHLLLGLFRSGNALARTILNDLRATEFSVRNVILELTGRQPPVKLPSVPAGVRSRPLKITPVSACPSVLGMISMAFPGQSEIEVEGALVLVRPGADPNAAFSELLKAIPDLAATPLRFKLPGERPIEKTMDGWKTIESEPERFEY